MTDWKHSPGEDVWYLPDGEGFDLANVYCRDDVWYVTGPVEGRVKWDDISSHSTAEAAMAAAEVWLRGWRML